MAVFLCLSVTAHDAQKQGKAQPVVQAKRLETTLAGTGADQTKVPKNLAHGNN
jgi:hypothetical protein